jgi:hypothetical protein
MSKLIEKEGKYYQECKLVILNTNEIAPFWLSKNNTLCLSNSVINPILGNNKHLYITSEENPEKGDWIIREGYPLPILMGDSLIV